MDTLAGGSGELEIELEVPGPEVRELFGLAYPDIAEFANMLVEEGELRGLIGPRELPRLWSRHLVNSAAVLDFLPKKGQVLDVGSLRSPWLGAASGLPMLLMHLVWITSLFIKHVLKNSEVRARQTSSLLER